LACSAHFRTINIDFFISPAECSSKVVPLIVIHGNGFGEFISCTGEIESEVIISDWPSLNGPSAKSWGIRFVYM
jgi:hypothetical protein